MGVAAMSSGNHQGGWGEPVHGTTADGQDVTASFGYGNRDGHTLLSDGHQDPEHFLRGHHDHYGPGNGPNDNGTQRGYYTGSGS
jgi:hypothetical protein